MDESEFQLGSFKAPWIVTVFGSQAAAASSATIVEDYWSLPKLQVAPSSWVVTVFGSQAGSAPAPTFTPSEDYLSSPLLFKSPWITTVFGSQAASQSFAIISEDYWLGGGPAPIWYSPPKQAITSDETLVAQPTVVVPNEDYWSPHFPPFYVVGSNTLLPVIFDTGDIAGGIAPPKPTTPMNIIRGHHGGSRMTPPYNP